MFFILLGTVCAVDVSASNTEDSNLTMDDVDTLFQENLEVSSEDSISETNIVNSHDDNLNDYPEDANINSYESYYEDNEDQDLDFANDDVLSVSSNGVLSSYSDDHTLKASGKIGTVLTVYDTHYDSSAAQFKVTLQDAKGNALAYKKITLKLNGKTYTGSTNKIGIVYIKTTVLAIGTYSVSVSYGGNSNYSASSVSKKVKVSTSVSGKDLTVNYGTNSYYSATFWKNAGYLTNTNVTFNIDGKKYVFKTNSKGVAVAKVNLKPGKHVISVVNPVTNEKITNNVVVNKGSSTFNATSKVYILPNNRYTYSVVLTSVKGVPISGATVTFNYANTTVSAKTDSNGEASTVIPVLDKGTYDISFTFKGNDCYYSTTSSGKICVKSSTTKFSASDLSMKYNDGSKFSVKVTDTSGKVLANKKVTFVLNDKKYYTKTNSKGIAQLSIGDLKPGSYNIKYVYSTRGLADYNYGYNKIVINKANVKLNAWNFVMKKGDNSTYKAYVKDSSGKPLKNVAVKFTVNGKTYTQKTDAKGVAKLKIDLPVGYYPVKTELSDTYYTASSLNKHILVNGTKFVASSITATSGTTVYYSVKLVDAKDNPVKSASVKFTIDGKTYTKKTDSSGMAKVNLGVLSDGYHTIKYAYDTVKGSSKINIVNKVTLKQIISASKTVKNYIESNNKLPSSVKIGSVEFTVAEFLYLASKATINLNKSDKSDISIKDVKNPTNPGSAANKGNLYDYLSVAKSLVKTADSKGQMPNSVNSSVGTIGYKGAVYAFARVVAFYGDNDIMPAYVAIKSLSSSSSSSSLNSKNTISNLLAYLAASTNCQVNNTKIKQLVDTLTKGLTTDKEKATVIFNYVRDTISYSFYYDTKYGAVGTLNSKKGNCVDHSHLLVAMFRTAGLPARYVHGTCTFTSGTYGHVWTQVLIGDTWTVCDATSARNSFGKVVNWNSNTYSLKGYYASIGF